MNIEEVLTFTPQLKTKASPILHIFNSYFLYRKEFDFFKLMTDIMKHLE